MFHVHLKYFSVISLPISLKFLHKKFCRDNISQKFFSESIIPFFQPALADEVKDRGNRWQKVLPELVDPAHMFVLVSSVKIYPRLARAFLKESPSSGKQMNDTRLFETDAKDTAEVTGSVSIFAELSAFNSKFSHYSSLRPSSRNKSWRWRKRTYGFNLSIVHPDVSEKPQRRHHQQRKCHLKSYPW